MEVTRGWEFELLRCSGAKESGKNRHAAAYDTGRNLGCTEEINGDRKPSGVSDREKLDAVAKGAKGARDGTASTLERIHP